MRINTVTILSFGVIEVMKSFFYFLMIVWSIVVIGQNDAARINAALRMIPAEEVPEIIGDTSCPLPLAFSEQELQKRKGGKWMLLGDRYWGCLVYSGGTGDPYIRTILYRVKNDSLTEVYNEYGRYIGMDSTGFYVYNGACCCNDWNEIRGLAFYGDSLTTNVLRYHSETKIQGGDVLRTINFNSVLRTLPEVKDSSYSHRCTGERVRVNTIGFFPCGEAHVLFQNDDWLQIVHQEKAGHYVVGWITKEKRVFSQSELKFGTHKVFFKPLRNSEPFMLKYEYLKGAVIEDSIDLSVFINRIKGVNNGYSWACGHYINGYILCDTGIVDVIKVNPRCRYFSTGKGEYDFTDTAMFDSLSVSGYWQSQGFSFRNKQLRFFRRLRKECKETEGLYFMGDESIWFDRAGVLVLGEPVKVSRVAKKYKRFISIPEEGWN